MFSSEWQQEISLCVGQIPGISSQLVKGWSICCLFGQEQGILISHQNRCPLLKELVLCLVMTIGYERNKSAVKKDDFLEGIM